MQTIKLLLFSGEWFKGKEVDELKKRGFLLYYTLS